jgi:MFS family permease
MSRTNSTSTTVKATLLLASTLTVMAGATISPALPAIQAHFTGTGNAALLVRLVLTMPALFIAPTAPLAGGVADRAECKPLLVGSTVLYAIAGGSGFVLDSLLAIIVGRAALGVAVGGITVGATALITDYYVGEQRDSVLGLQGSFSQFGGVLFLPLGGVLADVG